MCKVGLKGLALSPTAAGCSGLFRPFSNVIINLAEMVD
jgi:hypothetical protein